MFYSLIMDQTLFRITKKVRNNKDKKSDVHEKEYFIYIITVVSSVYRTTSITLIVKCATQYLIDKEVSFLHKALKSMILNNRVSIC